MNHSLVTVSCAVLATATSLLAQTQPQPSLSVIGLPARGMMPAFSAGFVFDGSPGVIARKRAGLPARLDTFQNTASAWVSEYSGEAILQCLRQQTTASVDPLQLDAVTSRNDLMPVVLVESSGTFQVVQSAAQAWSTLYMTVTGPGFDGNTVYGYYSQNPNFPPQLRSAIYTELVASDLAAGNLPVPGPNSRMAGLDVAVGLIHDNRGVRESNVLECVDRLYFSLTPSSAAALQASGAVSNPTPLDGATIFEAAYNTGTGLVSSVTVHRNGADFGLPEGSDIDALGMGWVRTPASGGSIGVPLEAGTMMYVLSTAYDPSLPPIEELFVVATPQGKPEQRGGFRAHNGQPLVGPGATEPFNQGRVTNVCEQDPEVPTGTMSFGVPRTLSVPGAPPVTPLNLSLDAAWSGVNPPDDRYLLTGVVSNVGQLGLADVFLCVHSIWDGQWQLFPLPRRLSTDIAYTFEQKLVYPWSGPATSGTFNDYEIFVATMPVGSSSATFDVTHASWLRRRYYP